MQLSRSWTSILVAALCLCAQGQNPPGPPSPPNKDAQAAEKKGMPPRATPGDYQAQATAGAVTIAAEFMAHAILTPEGTTYSTDDYVVVETALFGPAGTRLKISSDDFSLRILAKKMKPLPSEPFGGVLKTLKDPDWEDTIAIEAKKAKDEGGGSTSVKTGGKGQENTPYVAPKMPIPMRRAMEQHVEKCVLPEGDRALPQAGVIFFPYRGKTENIHAIELIYNGPAGKATLKLQP
jgi:hypothetical protein